MMPPIYRQDQHLQPVSQNGSSPSAMTQSMDQLVNLGVGTLGRTVATAHEPHSSHTFHCWLRADSDVAGAIEVGSIIVAVADDGSDAVFGTVNRFRAYDDIATVVADIYGHNFGDPDPDIMAPTDALEVLLVSCQVMRSLTGLARPVRHSRIMLPTTRGLRFALGQIDARGASAFSGGAIPVGILRNVDGTLVPVCIDEDYVIGPEAAHVNIAGVSGLAAKTSAIVFLCRSLLAHGRKRTAIVLLNVKGQDFLYLDRPNPRLRGDVWSQDAYNAIRVPPEPFIDARFFAPRSPENAQRTQSRRRLPTEPLSWSLPMVLDDLPTLFEQSDWDDRVAGAWLVVADEVRRGALTSYRAMLNWIDAELVASGRDSWVRGHHIATWSKLRARLRHFPQVYRGLLSLDAHGVDVPWHTLTGGSVIVIDAAMLDDRGTGLVLGRTIAALTEVLTAPGAALDAAIVVADELSKLAPAWSPQQTPLAARLVDIAARGRSTGLILFGGEQFASSVDQQVIDNAATHLLGRTEDRELAQPAYALFGDEIKARLRALPQGSLYVRAPKLSQGIILRFPIPPCASDDRRIEQSPDPASTSTNTGSQTPPIATPTRTGASTLNRAMPASPHRVTEATFDATGTSPNGARPTDA